MKHLEDFAVYTDVHPINTFTGRCIMKKIGTNYSILILTVALLFGSIFAPQTTDAARISSANTTESFSREQTYLFPFFFSTFSSTAPVVTPSFPFLLFTGLDIPTDLQKPDTTVALIDQTAPSRMFLDQNYPNPFRDATSIRYGIPRNSFVTVTIHTVLGSPVKTLVNERQKAGVFTINLSKPDLMPGLYFYRLQTEYGTLTRRLTISE